MLDELSMMKKNDDRVVLVLSTDAVSRHASTLGAMPTTLLGTTMVLLLKFSGHAENFITHRSSAKIMVAVIAIANQQYRPIELFIQYPFRIFNPLSA
jgi:hypothetical protein